MQDLLIEWHKWTEAFHVVFVIAWMAGMLYLPRLYVYHAEAATDGEASEMLKVMERRLLRIIINPAMLAAFLSGGLLLLTPGAVDWSTGWVYAKLVLVFTMTGFHGVLARWLKDFLADRNERSAAFYRKMNEVPTVLMIGIVILVIVKPF